MKRLLASLTLGAALVLAVSPAAPAFQAQGQVLNLQNADIRAFIQDVGRATGVTYVLDPRVQGTVTVTIDRPLSRAQMQEVLFSTLRANGLVAIPAGPNTFRVAPDEVAATLPSSAGGALTGFTTRVFELNVLEAADAAEVLRPLVGRSASVQAAPGNVLIVADYADNLSRIQAIIDQIDQDRFETRVVAVRNQSARSLVQSVPFLAIGEGVDARLAITAVEASNAIVLRGEPRLVAQAQGLIEDLDARAASDSDIRVVRLQHASAGALLPVLRGLVSQETPASEAAPGRSEPGGRQAASPVGSGATRRQASITQFEGANALVIAADPETQRVLAEVIRELDVRRDQVLVEAIVVEVSEGLAERLGVQVGAGGEGGGFVTNFPNASPGLIGIAAGAAAGGSAGAPLQNIQAGALADLLSTPGAVGAFGAQAGEVVFGAIVNAVKSDSDSNLLSTPSILTLDNEPARLLVGQEVPITTGEVLGSANTNPFRTIERRDVGVQLEVTPQINAGGSITLVLRQEVSSVAGPAVTGFSELAFNKRELQSTILVDDGQIVVIGGLLDQTDRQGADRVPGLSSLPGIGGLFRSSSRDTSRRNLMVFIRARKVSDSRDAQAATAQAYETMRRAEVTSRQDARSALEEAVRDYMRAAPPRAPAP